MFGFKLKAGALQFTLFISIVIALLLMAFILLVQTHKRFTIQTNFIKETIENTNKGVAYALLNELALNDTVSIDLNDEAYKSLKVYRDYWGIFEKVSVSSKIKTNSFQKTALLGAVQPAINRTALYLQDNNKPLVVVGTTKIKGVSYLPKVGVKPGTISGNFYYGTQLIYGEIKTALQFPELQNELLSHTKMIDRAFTKIPQHQYLNLEYGKRYVNSFLDPVQIIFNKAAITLSNVSISGHIIIQSQTKISVEASSNLKDVILIAPKIEIKNDVKGNFQAIASDELFVKDNCNLNYPSALVLLKKEIKSQPNAEIQVPLKINSNSIIKGTIIYSNAEQQYNYKIKCSIANNSILYGELYCNDNLELNGTVFGSVYTNNFATKQSGSVYLNHIYNGAIIVDSLSTNYMGLPFKNSKKGILQWLY